MALTKIYKKVEQENGTMTIYGSQRWIKIDFSRDMAGDSFFMYRGRRYYLHEFMAVRCDCPDWLREFHGYLNDSFFSGVLIKWSDDGESVQAFTFIG